MTDETIKLDPENELCKFYRTLAAIQIAAVDYVRVQRKKNENNDDYSQRVAQKAKEVTTAFENLNKYLLTDRNPPQITSGKVSGPHSELQFLMRDDCADSSLCWDPVTKTCVAC